MLSDSYISLSSIFPVPVFQVTRIHHLPGNSESSSRSLLCWYPLQHLFWKSVFCHMLDIAILDKLFSLHFLHYYFSYPVSAVLQISLVYAFLWLKIFFLIFLCESPCFCIVEQTIFLLLQSKYYILFLFSSAYSIVHCLSRILPFCL